MSGVEQGSIAAELGLERGDRILSVNGRALRDEIDWRFYSADEDVAVLVRKRDGQETVFDVEKDPGEPLGVSFAEPIFDRIKTCRNRCVFCFLSQLPKGMRRQLYLHDDDYRMSFLFGNFVTLTNLAEEDWERLREQRLSPLRISVHTTDPRLRQEMMGNPEAADVMDRLLRLSDMGIEVHAQIVLMKGWNDGVHLWRTLSDLDSLGEGVGSVGVVPAVYTRYRASLPSPKVDKAWAGETLDIIEQYAKGALVRRGQPWAYAADEFYFVAEREFPLHDYYGDFPQYENGIGIVADFRAGVSRALQTFHVPGPERGPEGGPSARWPRPQRASHELGGKKEHRAAARAIVFTGTMAAEEVRGAVMRLGLGDRLEVCPVQNRFFGDTVTASGLLTGQDIAAQALLRTRSRDHGYGSLLVPSVALKDGRFLDDMELGDLSKMTGVPAYAVEPSAEGLLRALFS